MTVSQRELGGQIGGVQPWCPVLRSTLLAQLASLLLSTQITVPQGENMGSPCMSVIMVLKHPQGLKPIKSFMTLTNKRNTFCLI